MNHPVYHAVVIHIKSSLISAERNEFLEFKIYFRKFQFFKLSALCISYAQLIHKGLYTSNNKKLDTYSWTALSHTDPSYHLPQYWTSFVNHPVYHAVIIHIKSSLISAERNEFLEFKIHFRIFHCFKLSAQCISYGQLRYKVLYTSNNKKLDTYSWAALFHTDPSYHLPQYWPFVVNHPVYYTVIIHIKSSFISVERNEFLGFKIYFRKFHCFKLSALSISYGQLLYKGLYTSNNKKLRHIFMDSFISRWPIVSPPTILTFSRESPCISRCSNSYKV